MFTNKYIILGRNDIMITYFKMKIKEHKIKLALYSSIEEIMNEKEDIITTIKNLYLSLKDTPIEEMQNKFISELAEFIHNDTHSNNTKSDLTV